MVNGAPVKGSSPNTDALIVPRKGLQLPQRLAYDKWLEIGQRLSDVTSSSAWCLGDWLVFGEIAYKGRYREAIAKTMLDYQTLRNYAWVARRFALSRRRDTLSFGHHAEVAAMPEAEREYWLNKSEELSWTRNQLRREVQASRREREHVLTSGKDVKSLEPGKEETDDRATAGAAPRAVDHPGVTFEVSFSGKRLDTCRAAASISGISLENWVLRTLEEAAKDTLNGTALFEA